GGAFLPVHWGTFNLAMHAWDEPADTLLALSEQSNVQLLMPRQGQALEPAHADRAEPRWRAVDTVAAPAVPASDAAADQAKTIPWPLD
ncbi:hypothetical protein C3E98_037100, partial [Pseudomonas sp. MWU13-2625]